MADFDAAVRQALRDAVPPDLLAEPYALVDGAARRARRMRTTRVAGAGVAAVAVAALAGLTVWLGPQRPAPEVPAMNPVARELCTDPRPTKPPAQATTGLSGDAAAVCPTGKLSGPGWVLPGAPLTLQRWVEYLRGGIASTPSSPCRAGTTAEPPFVMVVRQIGGMRTAYRSTDLACGGREAMARYLAALAYQQADVQAATTSGYELTCSPPKGDDAIPLTPPMASIHAVHSSGLLCTYPVYDPSRTGQLTARDYHATPLTVAQLNVIHIALSTARFTSTPPPACPASSRELVLHLTTPGDHGPAGERIDLVGTCVDALRFDGYALWWQPPSQVRMLLADMVRAG